VRLIQDTKLDFQDVLLVPKRSTIQSRKEINLLRTFKFRYVDWTWTGVPIISSNMTSVTTIEVARVMSERGMLACMPKNFNGSSSINSDFLIKSIGLNSFVSNINYDCCFLCLDVPNGYIESVVDKVREIRSEFRDVVIMAGNVVTPEMTEALILAGADIVKVGIGSGAACSTRIKTGVGYPQLSAVIECADAAHGLGGHIISDGGCGTPGDVVKAFAAGADFVMLGAMLASHDENGTEFYGMASEKGATEIAGGLKNYRASEGWEFNLPRRGPLENTLQEITGGIRSACAYVGAKNIKDLPKCATFVRVNRIANSSLWEHRI